MATIQDTVIHTFIAKDNLSPTLKLHQSLALRAAASLNKMTSSVRAASASTVLLNKHLRTNIALLNRAKAASISYGLMASRHFKSSLLPLESIKRRVDDLNYSTARLHRTQAATRGLPFVMGRAPARGTVAPQGAPARGRGGAGLRALGRGGNLAGIASGSAALRTFGLTARAASLATTGFATGVGGATLAVGALALTIGLSVGAHAVFERSMKRVQAVTQGTASEMAFLSQQSKALAQEMPFTPTQIAKGATFLGMAGFKPPQIGEALKPTLHLASIGMLDVGTAADISTNIMTQFGHTAYELSHDIDVLAKTVTQSNVNVRQMATSMSYLGPVANSLGISVEETSAAIGLLGNRGIQGTKAGSAFATSLTRLASPPKKASDSLKMLGIEVFNAKGKFVGITDTIRQLEAAFKKLTPEQEAAHTYAIFGARAYKHWSSLINEGADSFERFTNMLINSNGEAARMAHVIEDNLIGDFTRLGVCYFLYWSEYRRGLFTCC